MDPTNPVVALCAAGMAAEGRGEPDVAAALFIQAWDQSSDDWERCVAAHYVARHQPNARLTLEWNERALRLSEEVNDDRTTGFLPSLHLNVGRSHEDLGDFPAAGTAYRAAAEAAGALGDDGYGDMLRRGIAAGLERISAASAEPADDLPNPPTGTKR